MAWRIGAYKGRKRSDTALLHFNLWNFCLLTYYSTGNFVIKNIYLPKIYSEKHCIFRIKKFSQIDRASPFSFDLSKAHLSSIEFACHFLPLTVSQFDEGWWLAALRNGHKPTPKMVSVSDNQVRPHRFQCYIFPSVRPSQPDPAAFPDTCRVYLEPVFTRIISAQ